MKHVSPFLAAIVSGLFACPALNAQFAFTNSNTSLHSDNGTAGSNANNRSGNSVAIVDVNNDGLDDIVKLDNTQYVRIEYQQPGGTFTYQYIGDFGTNSCWGMSVADVDHNGYKDVLFLGGSQAKLMKLNNTGTGILGAVIDLPNGNIFCQNGNFMDVNNDGWEDIFACNDVGQNRIWVNDGAGNFPAEAANTAINFDVTPGGSGQNDESGNYSSVWSDFDNDGDVDLFVAHCRQAYGPGDLRRTDRLFVNNANGTYTEAGATYNLNSNDQDWTGAFGDIDNDGDFDLFLTKHDVTSKYYINDGTGHMTVSPNAIPFGSMPMQSLFEDFDNDGFVDLMITGDNDHRLYHNNGDGTFSDQTPSNFTISGTNMLSFAAGDLNHDGRIDLYSSYGSTYTNPSGSIDDRYWRNTTSNSNHYLTLVLNGVNSTAGALGARAYIYGTWGVQTREVRASESYGTLNSFHLHFGLGAATTVDSIVVKWPSGNVDRVISEAADQFITIVENQCTLSSIAISYTGATTFCPGDSIVLTAPADPGYTYQWSTGATTQSIVAYSQDDYSVTVFDGGPGCQSTSPPVSVIANPAEVPTITVNGDLLFCPGGSVTLTSSSASSYLWSNSSNTQSIQATAPGNYYVTVPGMCQNWTSDTIVVSNYFAPAPTVGPDVWLPAPASATVTATGNDISWYDAPVGGNLLHTGSSYPTPVISADVTFYAEDKYIYGGFIDTVGSADISGATYSTNSLNGFLVFDVTTDCILRTVEVTTDAAGARTIELRNSGGTVIADTTVNLAAGTSVVTLNFSLTPGTDYQLGTNTAQNNTTFGYNSPRLLRTQNDSSFPYSIAGYIDINEGNNGSNPVTAYYYFYNWVVEAAPDITCITSRSGVDVHISNVGTEPVSEFGFSLYPNPAEDHVNIRFTTGSASEATLTITDMLGRQVRSMNLGKVDGAYMQTISTGGLEAGVYKVTLGIGGKRVNTLVVIK